MSFLDKLKSFIPWVTKDVKEGNYDRAKEKVITEAKETEAEIKEKIIEEITDSIMNKIEDDVDIMLNEIEKDIQNQVREKIEEYNI